MNEAASLSLPIASSRRQTAFEYVVTAIAFVVAYGQAPLYYSNQNQYFLHGLANAGVGRLSDDFPSKQIFMDVYSIDFGENFVETIKETVGSCDVLIAVIGKGWLT